MKTPEDNNNTNKVELKAKTPKNFTYKVFKGKDEAYCGNNKSEAISKVSDLQARKTPVIELHDYNNKKISVYSKPPQSKNYRVTGRPIK